MNRRRFFTFLPGALAAAAVPASALPRQEPAKTGMRMLALTLSRSMPREQRLEYACDLNARAIELAQAANDIGKTL